MGFMSAQSLLRDLDSLEIILHPLQLVPQTSWTDIMFPVDVWDKGSQS